MNETSQVFRNKYLIYIDRAGASSRIVRDDPIYGNREGFYEMSALYHEPFDHAKELFGDDFLYYGFSDTILVLILNDNIELIAKLASQIYLSLLGYSIHSKLFITHGDFAYHNFEELKSKTNVFISPVYGSTLLKSYELDKSKIEYFGVFVEDIVAEKFSIKQKIDINDGNYIYILDLEKYLEKSKFQYLLNIFRSYLEEEDIEKTKQTLLDNPTIKGLIDLMKEYNVPDDVIESSLIEDTIKRNQDRRAIKNKMLNTYNTFKSNS